MLLRLAVCAAMGGARLVELSISRRNIEGGGPTSEGEWSRRTYPGIIAVHTLTIAVTALKGSKRPSWPWLLLLLSVQPVRIWVLATLGRRWNTRAAVPRLMDVETRGPYRWVRHPNYAVVAVELAALPLAFRLPWLALASSVTNAALLAGRIREEEAALRALPGWEEHFGPLPRFIPRAV